MSESDAPPASGTPGLPNAVGASRGSEPRPEPRPREGDGFRLYGVTRGGAHWQLLRRRRERDGEPTFRLRYRDIEALVRRAPLSLPELSESAVLEHHRILDRAMRDQSILPAPHGVIFRSRKDLLRFLRDQYAILDEALSLVEGQWEVRLHLVPSGGGPPLGDPAATGAEIYDELRRFARSSLPLAPEGERVFSAAFLVSRDEWIHFWERAEDVTSRCAGLRADLTGPWPPYDFVQMVV